MQGFSPGELGLFGYSSNYQISLAVGSTCKAVMGTGTLVLAPVQEEQLARTIC